MDHDPDLPMRVATQKVFLQDLHLATSTVREALTFSALLRQKASIPKEEKLAYVGGVFFNLHLSAEA